MNEKKEKNNKEKIDLKEFKKEVKEAMNTINLKITEESLKDWNLADIIKIMARETYNKETRNLNFKFYLVSKDYDYNYDSFTGEELELNIYQILASDDLEIWLKRGKKLKTKWKKKKQMSKK